jgi:hypothetical protein
VKVDLLVLAGSAAALWVVYKWGHERGRALGYGRGWLDGRNPVVSGKPKTPAELAAEATVLQPATSVSTSSVQTTAARYNV